MKIIVPKFEEIFSFENILASFNEFKRGKHNKKDVAEFSMNLVSNICTLRDEMMAGSYQHGGYKYFKIFDPKNRDIHKASVRDRIVHHCLYRSLYFYFNNFFIHDSYSCRFGKGTHRALKRFDKFGKSESFNNKKTVWILKCDIKKCFASVDQRILKVILRKYIFCPKITQVVGSVVDSFNSGILGKGIPLGNLTSQLFINIYMNEFDQFMKRRLKVRFYIRYADDFVMFDRDRDCLLELILLMANFLDESLGLVLHPNKIYLKTFASGMDFLGWVNFSNHKVLRMATKKRMFRKIIEKGGKKEIVESYLGLLSYGNEYNLQMKVKSLYDIIEL